MEENVAAMEISFIFKQQETFYHSNSVRICDIQLCSTGSNSN